MKNILQANYSLSLSPTLSKGEGAKKRVEIIIRIKHKILCAFFCVLRACLPTGRVKDNFQ
jgi:hypothetical protein